jgi:hypothetical protein
MRRHIVSVAIVLLASVSVARAAYITYNIVDYPANQVDVNGGVDTVSGTIITDGTLGPVYFDGNLGHIVGGTLNFAGASGSVSYGPTRLSGYSSYGLPLFYATPTQFLLPDGYSFVINAYDTNEPGSKFVMLAYIRESLTNSYEYGGRASGGFIGSGGEFAEFNPSPRPESIAANDPWIIATGGHELGIIDWKGGSSASTDWNDAVNWNPEPAVPNGTETKVSFGNQTAANNTVDMISQGQTVGTMSFSAKTSTTIQSTGGFALTLDNGGSLSTIDVAGTHTISAPVVLNNDAIISGTGTLSLSGGITGSYDLAVETNLTATSIQVDTLTLGAGATVTIQAIPGGPLGNTITAIPEPSTFVLLGMGVISLLVYAWRLRSFCCGRYVL